MKASRSAPTARPIGLSFPLLLALILAALFWKSFVPGYVHFANDGPLGEQNAAWSRFPGAMTGAWGDLNDIGSNAGISPPDITSLEDWFLGPVGYSKFYTAIALFILGLGAWTFFRQLKVSPLAAAFGALATALNSSYFGNACWGTASQQVAMAMVFFALALVMANSDETRPLIYWSRLALAGMAVGMSVMEGADNGAIFSLFVAAYVFFKSLAEEGAPALKRIGRGIGQVALIAFFAAFIATEFITSLVGTFILGTAGMGQDQSMESPQHHWDWATQWSIPKKETLGVFVPGLFGYRMNTPTDMMGPLQEFYQGGEYWGGIGRSPEIDRFFDSGAPGKPPSAPDLIMRFGYGASYCGILTALVALFAIVQSLRRQNSVFSKVQRHFIWFWTAALIVALLLAWGRFAPFYHILYLLPYFSTIRNPGKFMAIFHLAVVIIFAYGMDAVSRRYLQVSNGKLNSWLAQFKNWRANVRGFDRNWCLFSIAAFVASVLAWLIYWSQKARLADYLQKVGFDADTGKQIAAFSIGQAGWFLLFFATAIALFILVLAGVFSGKRARLGGLLLGAFLVVDLGRANLPWIIHWDYIQKYDIDRNSLAISTNPIINLLYDFVAALGIGQPPTKSTNPIINLLRDKRWEHRVADLRSDSLFEELYRIEWLQQHFPYYNIQSSDIVQSPRVASDLAAYDMALAPTPTTPYLVTRRWQLTNTRYFLGPANYLDSINEQLDPAQRRFRIVQRFDVVPKPGIEKPTELEQLTAVPNDNGEYALFEFTGALPRAGLYSNWQVNTNDSTTLRTLAAENFDPQKTVLVSTPLPGEPLTNSASGNPGAVEYKSYAPKDIVLSAQAGEPSVLLLNDKFDPNWHVSVDGQPANLLRCNFIMRGVFLPPGAHTVEFEFSLPHKPLYVTLTAIGGGILLCGLLFFSRRKSPVLPDNALNALSFKETKKDARPQAVAGRPRNRDVRPASE